MLFIIELSSFIQVIINGLLIGGVYGLMAMGLGIIFGVMKIVNVAHGEFVMLGAYASFWLFFFSAGFITPFLSLPISILLGFLVGLIVYKVAVHRVVKAPELTSLLLMFGIGIFISNTALYVWKSEYRGIPFTLPSSTIAGVTIPLVRLSALILTLVITAIIYLLFKKTYIGKAIRAVAQDRDAASLMGINASRISMFAFGLGISLAFAVGSLITMIIPAIHPYMGAALGPLSFSIAVLGGLGSEKGAMVGGLIIGLTENISGMFIQASLAPAIYFIILVVVLLVKPTGLFGKG